ncbi:unnamed protein product [Linum trigynum]|uniref:Uncharacterized protein n=1 Tax=Linum trigynum TaxID=586398 RepID=A0AAV2EQF2_9ROSI
MPLSRVEGREWDYDGREWEYGGRNQSAEAGVDGDQLAGAERTAGGCTGLDGRRTSFDEKRNEFDWG